MSTVRIGTFNCENLFARYNFKSNVNPDKAVKSGFNINMTRFTILSEKEKKLTAKAIVELDADIMALQEIENLDVLKRFRSDWLKKLKYTFAMLVDGNDPRQIDVAVLSRFPIVAVRSYQHLRDGRSFLFSRDCLVVDVQVNGKNLTLFVNHLKSMYDRKDPAHGRKNTREKRVKQAAEVKKIVKAHWGSDIDSSAWAIVGDFNDYLGTGQGTSSGITNLVTWSKVENVVDRLPAAERWTHFYGDAIAGEPRVRQLDYILLSPSLAAGTTALPVIERKGLSTRATEAGTARFSGVTANSFASDHCPVAIDIEL